MTRIRFDAAATFLIAAAAFALSYSQLVDLAIRAGYAQRMAHVWPLVVDGLAVVATAAVMRLPGRRVYAWAMLVIGTAVSVAGAAAAHLLPAGPLSPGAGAAVVVIPPLCLPLAIHLAVQLRRNAAATAEAYDVETVTHQPSVDAVAPERAEQDVAPTDVADDAAAADTDAKLTTECDTVDASPEPAAAVEPIADCVTLFDMPRRNATATGVASSKVTPEQRADALHLLATTTMSQRAIAIRLGLSKDMVNRMVPAGGRDALRAAWQADATPALAAVGG